MDPVRMSVTAALVDLAVDVIDRLGYPGVFVLMALESMVAPVPSEAVMPFAGFLVAEGEMNLWLVAVVATLGSLLGSWLSFEMGKYLGRPFVVRWGKWFLLSEKDLDWTDRFFRRWGPWAVFIGRFVPVVRHLISIPAGLARMALVPFFVATAVGAFAWNFFLAWIGFKLGENWERVRAWLEPIDLAILALLVIVFVWFFAAHWRRFRAEARARTASSQDE